MTKQRHIIGMAKTRFRRLAKVQIQFLPTANAINLKKLVKILELESIKFSLKGFSNKLQLDSI